MSPGKRQVLDRIKEFYGFRNNAELARFFDVAPSTVSNWYTRESIDYDLIFTKCKGINYDWLLKGVGIDKNTVVVKEHEVEYQVKRSKRIPFFDSVSINSSRSNENADPEEYYIEMIDPGDLLRDATAAMRIYDNAMEPNYKPGNIIALKEVKNIELVLFGQDYVIETSEYRILKRIQQTEDSTIWLACSCNASEGEVGPLKGRLIHGPFNIHINEIKRLFIVIGCFTRSINSIASNKD